MRPRAGGGPVIQTAAQTSITHMSTPHPRRGVALAVALAILLAAGLAGPPGAPSGPALASAKCKDTRKHPNGLSTRKAARAVVCLINARRASRGRGRLDRKRDLGRAARRHSTKMRRSGCFGHQCPGEGALASRTTHTGYLPCACRWGVGEVIGQGRNRRGSPRAVVRSWMRSGAHRRTILNGSYRHVGPGVVHGVPGHGTRSGAIYTVDFGYKR